MSKSGALANLFSSPSLYWIKTVIKLYSTGLGVSSRGIRDQFGGWGGGERIDEVWNLGTANTSQRYLQIAVDLRCSSWCLEQIFEDRECFHLQVKCMMSASVEIVLYWAWLKISVWENEPKLKETTVNYFALRHHIGRLKCIHVSTGSP